MRCVKCVGKHMTIICQKTKNEKLKCVSCGEYTLLIIELMWPWEGYRKVSATKSKNDKKKKADTKFPKKKSYKK